MTQPTIEESLDYIMNYNLYFFSKRRLYHYMHQIALATGKPKVADVYKKAISELSPDNAFTYTVPQNLENELLEIIDPILKKYSKYEIITFCDSATTWIEELKKSRKQNDVAGLQTLVACALDKDNADILNFALKENNNNTETLLSCKNNVTALQFSAALGKTECVKALLEAKADVNATDKHGNTALIQATWSGKPECVKVLLEAKADVNATGWLDQTALMEAAKGGKTECVKVLLEAKADVNATDATGDTALMKAASFGETECLKVLLEAMADVNATDAHVNTALMEAAGHGKPECVKVLLEAKADVNATDEEGDTALMKAARGGETECVKVLLEAKADVNATDAHGNTALMWAAARGHVECVKALLEAKADVNATDEKGETALFQAAATWRGETECVKALLEAKADVNATNKKGETALMQAACRGNTECVKALLARGADWQLKDHKGKTAYGHAKCSVKVNNSEVLVIFDNLYDEWSSKIVNNHRFWEKCYSLINVGIAVIFTAWILMSSWQKSSIKGSWIDITLYIIGCLVPLIIKTIVSVKADNRPDNKSECIVYVVTDFLCAMALSLPAISDKIVSSFSGFVWLSMLAQLVIAVFLGMIVYIKRWMSARTISILNVLIAITLFYLGGGVLTGSDNFLDNIFTALMLGY